MVKVGTHTEGISEELIQKILSIPDVRTIERGDTTFYVVGSFDAIPEALRRELELKGMGITSEVMAEEGGQLIDVSTESAAERAKMVGMGAGDDSRDVIIRVQLGAFRNKLSKNIFSKINDLVVIQGDDGLGRLAVQPSSRGVIVEMTEIGADDDPRLRPIPQGIEHRRHLIGCHLAYQQGHDGEIQEEALQEGQLHFEGVFRTVGYIVDVDTG